MLFGKGSSWLKAHNGSRYGCAVEMAESKEIVVNLLVFCSGVE